MKKKCNLRFFYLSIVCSVLLITSSCTYDYFEDETNYVVYVPKADHRLMTESYSIQDLSIFIFNDLLYRERYSINPFDENVRSQVGNFNFSLYPGKYYVYCFTNAENTTFDDIKTYNQAKFNLKQNTDGTYQEPSALSLEYRAPNIKFPGPTVTDTANFESQYAGRICVAFKNMTTINPSLTFENIKDVQITASGIGVMQYFSMLSDSLSTRSSMKNINDMMKLTCKPFHVDYKNNSFDFGIQNYYYPSPQLSEGSDFYNPISMKMNFLGNNNEILLSMTVNVVDKSGNPVILHMNQTLVVEVDGNTVQVLNLDDLESWNPIVSNEGGSGPGTGGGIGI